MRADCWPHSARTAIGIEGASGSQTQWVQAVVRGYCIRHSGVGQVEHTVLHDTGDVVYVRESSSMYSSGAGAARASCRHCNLTMLQPGCYH